MSTFRAIILLLVSTFAFTVTGVGLQDPSAELLLQEDEPETVFEDDDIDSDVTILMQTTATVDEKRTRVVLANLDADEEPEEDVTMLMQTTGYIHDRRAGASRINWTWFARLAVTLLIFLPALFAYMGVPEVMQAWGAVLGNGALRGAASPGPQGRLLSEQVTAAPASHGEPISEEVLDALMEEPCCDGAVPGLQTSVELLLGAPVNKPHPKAPEHISDDVLDAMLAEPSVEELMQPNLPTKLSLIKSESAKSKQPASVTLQSKDGGSVNEEDPHMKALLDAIEAEDCPECMTSMTRLQTGASRIYATK